MRLITIGSILAGAAILAGCGKGAKADKQDVITLDVPGLPNTSSSVFALQGDKKSTGYKSTMLVLNPTGSPQLLAEVIRVSEDVRVKSAQSRAFMIKEARFLPGGAAEKELADKNAELKDFVTKSRDSLEPVPLPDRQQNAKAWLETAVAGAGLTPEVQTMLQGKINNYCDAKIVELASHPEFAARSSAGYRQRPTPQQFCEAYYEARGYFKGESCTNGDFFTCLWVEGVMKSGSMLTQNGTDLTSILQPIFADKTKTDTFRNLLISTQDATTSLLKTQVESTISAASYRTLTADIFDKRQFFAKGLVNAKPSAGNEDLCKKLLKDQTYAFICGSFGRTWKERTPQAYINDIETDAALINNNPPLKPIVNVLRFFGARPLDKILQASNSDVMFQDLTAALAAPTQTKLGVSPDDMAVIDSEFEGRVFPGLSKEALEGKAQRENAIKALQDEMAAKKEENDRLIGLGRTAIEDGIRAATAGDVAFAFLSYIMTVEHLDNIMRATINFDGALNHYYEGCYDKTALAPVDCPKQTGNQVMHKAKLNLNAAPGRIDFSFIVEDPDATGLGYNPKDEESPQYFSNLSSAEMKGMNLRFELYPNRLENALDILTGKTLFSRDGRDIYEAGLSMWEL